ncbi:hypothetical protein OPV22_020147 [Ensete ventricosum]|uniref:Uncharacterized protein n=1 Tax=Ensete ventricosum TaxID=4639 RepID=A0AAV8P9Y4_ENSVE|nr:hypothetical protein OPV22_020147 [Ensete ventricosum]
MSTTSHVISGGSITAALKNLNRPQLWDSPSGWLTRTAAQKVPFYALVFMNKIKVFTGATAQQQQMGVGVSSLMKMATKETGESGHGC